MDKDRRIKGERYSRLIMDKQFWMFGTAVGIGLFCLIYAMNSKNWIWFAPCVFSWIVAAALFYKGYGFRRVLTTPFEETKDYITLAHGVHYALELELNKRMTIIRRLEEERRAMMKYYAWGAVFIGLGIYCVANKFEYLKLELLKAINGTLVLSYLMILAGVCLIVIGVRMIWKAFINSNLTISLRISDWFTIETITIKLWRENKLVELVTDRIEKERKASQKEMQNPSETSNETKTQTEAQTNMDADKDSLDKENEII